MCAFSDTGDKAHFVISTITIGICVHVAIILGCSSYVCDQKTFWCLKPMGSYVRYSLLVNRILCLLVYQIITLSKGSKEGLLTEQWLIMA